MPYVRPDVQTILTMLAAQPGPAISEQSPAEARQMMKMMGQVMELPRGDLAEVKDLAIPGPAGTIPARLYRASLSPAAAPVLVFFHGGGWVIGDLDVYEPLCAEICRVLGMTVVSVDYRLAPEHRFPAAAEDCLAAARWVAGSPAEIGHPVTGIVPAGDSAGGNLTAVVAQELNGQLPVPVIAQWLIYPAVDMTANEGSMQEFAEGYLLTADAMAWFTAHYMADDGGIDHLHASPYKRESLHGQPPAMVFTCSLDPLRDQGRAYAARLVSHGVRTVYREAEGQIHGCMTLRQGIPSAQADLHACLHDLRLLLDEAGTRTLAQAAE